MIEHLFFTGEIQIGKSTLLREYLAAKYLSPSGFRTVWGDEAHETLHLLPFSGGVCSEENCVAQRVDGHLLPRPAVFDRLGPPLLVPRGDILVMDELGFLERDAPVFQSAVLAALDGDFPVLGVIKPRAAPFLDAVRARARVRVVTVTSENRETLLSILL